MLPGGANQFYALVNDRRSVRNFSKKPVDYEIIRKCIQAAGKNLRIYNRLCHSIPGLMNWWIFICNIGTSPSGAHTEPWTFCVIENIEIKTAIRDIIEREEYENYTHRMSRQWTADLQPLKTDYRKEYLSDAPYLILIFKQIYGKYWIPLMFQFSDRFNVIILSICGQVFVMTEQRNNITTMRYRPQSQRESCYARYKPQDSIL